MLLHVRFLFNFLSFVLHHLYVTLPFALSVTEFRNLGSRNLKSLESSVLIELTIESPLN